MKIEKLGDRLGVVIPDDLARSLELKVGDEVDLHFAKPVGSAKPALTDEERQAAIARLQATRGPALQEWRFSRAEANGFSEE